ncbi:shikimate dehydrogenase family protein [Negadavirga shengliensis]|uniref:Shikimate dehydrogenase family protein n=1 Tax=Negadavirga shengliensis TaxID=1389218 RepID=A0ABV9SVW0_9BACT
MKKYGLIGYPLTHSFSKKYFSEKFEREGKRDCQYELYEIPEINQLPGLIASEKDLVGLNVTIPYKEKVIPFLDRLDPSCRAIGAVNCIKIREGQLVGFNTDYFGFKESLEKWLGKERPKALVLGTGGASKAVAEVLKDLGMDFLKVSRNAGIGDSVITYEQLYADKRILKDHLLIINTTPRGTYPNTGSMPDIPMDGLGNGHRVYDLVYNPEETLFMRAAAERGAATKNGMEMLHLQAEAAWNIWN